MITSNLNTYSTNNKYGFKKIIRKKKRKGGSIKTSNTIGDKQNFDCNKADPQMPFTSRLTVQKTRQG